MDSDVKCFFKIIQINFTLVFRIVVGVASGYPQASSHLQISRDPFVASCTCVASSSGTSESKCPLIIAPGGHYSAHVICKSTRLYTKKSQMTN